MSLTGLALDRGQPLPLGVHFDGDGCNFALFSRHGKSITLLLFELPTDATANTVIRLDPDRNKTGDVWHIRLMGVGCTLFYAWQVDGEFAPEDGHRFNPQNILLDPYAKALAGTDCWDFRKCCNHNHPHVPFGENITTNDTHYKANCWNFMTCNIHNEPHVPSSENIATDDSHYKAKCLFHHASFDWQDDKPPKHVWSDMIIYETHVRGLTIHQSSDVEHPGTFLGLVEKIPYFQSLGVTAIELLPVQEFFENELPRTNPIDGKKLKNYWGYSTIAFFAPKESYSTREFYGASVSEFKTMVRELHKAGIEVILDIVFNHTAEGNHLGPSLNFRGLDNSIYYMLEDNKEYYKNYSGTGNTLNCNHPVVRDYILDCLRYWVIDMHVDGFRFDLASVLGRDEHGNMLANPPLLERIAEDPVLRGVKLIAEAWDAGGAYQLGNFHGLRWSEWNGRFRDDVRRFWRGDPGMSGALASRFCGSADVYQFYHKQPIHSINFVTCHDGFTLADLVSFESKHNLENAEHNADGCNENFSSNCGVEGGSDDPQVETLRHKRIKNMLATLLLARGVPMLLGGDEMRRSQSGNNNAYCQDSLLSWYDWTLLDKNQDIFQLVRTLIALRKHYPMLKEQHYYSKETICWFKRAYYDSPDWDEEEGVIGCIINDGQEKGARLAVLFNASQQAVTFELPAPQHKGGWKILINTADLDITSVSNAHTYDCFEQSLVLCEDSMNSISLDESVKGLQ